MKKFILFFVLLVFVLSVSLLHSEVIVEKFIRVNGARISKTEFADLNLIEDVKYVELLGKKKFLKDAVIIKVDYGENDSYIYDQKKKDSKGNPQKMEFKSMVDSLNYMSQNGWEYVNSYVISHGDDNVYHYLLRKK